MVNIFILGSIAYDNIFSADRVPVYGERVLGEHLGKFVGGMAANQAIEAARYLNNVEILGKVGGDPEGKSITLHLNAHNVGTKHLLIDENLTTGQSYMYLVGDDYFSIVTPGANQQILPWEIAKAVDSLNNGILMVSLEICAGAALAALVHAQEHNIESFLIPSPPEACNQDHMTAADSLILNRREARKLFDLQVLSLEETKRELMNLDVHYKRLIVTMGSEGAVMREGNNIYSSASLPVTPLDTIGAGDAFSGAFISALALGMSSQKALSIGCIAGGLTVSVVGAQASTHNLKTVLELYKNHYSE
jgi:ribokinase